MTRRPKLSLSPAHNVDKKLPPGFETTAKAANPPPPESATAQSPGIKEHKPEQIGPRDPASADNKLTPQATVWPTKQIVKVAIAVVAAALSLYLLKRRFL